MFDKIVSFSLNQRLLVLSIAALLLVYGVYVSRGIPIDVFPDLNRPTVTILTEAHGLAPEEVETLITFPIETATNGASGVLRVRSSSSIGFSIVWVEFDWGIDIYAARQIVTERLQQVSPNLPPGTVSTIGPITSIMGEIMLLGLDATGSDIDQLQLRAIAEWDIRQRLLAIPGIAQVAVIGGEKPQYQVLIHPDKLLQHGVTLREVEDALVDANINSTGGFLLDAHQEYLIRNLARVENASDLEKTIIPRLLSHEAPALTIEQLGEVRFSGPLAKRGDASINGNPGVILSIQKQPEADTLALTAAIEKELALIQRSLPAGVTLHPDIFRQEVFIQNAISNVKEALRDGAIMVAIVLFLFLFNLRTAFISLCAIPFSFIITAIIFFLFGLSINTMTLGGLAVAIGELVDDAVVGVENVFRRLKENRQVSNPKPVLEVIYSATTEVRNSIIFSTIIIVLVFLPLFALGGIEGRIFLPLGISYLVAIVASTVVAITVTPVLSYYLLPGLKVLKDTKDSAFVARIKEYQHSLLRWLLPRTTSFLVTVSMFFLVALLGAFFLGREFLPEFNEGSATINITMAPGTSLQESNRIGSIAERLLLSIPEIKKTGRRTGRAELDEHALGVNTSEIEVEFYESERSRREVLANIREKLTSLPGVLVNVGQPITHRIDHMLSGVRAQVAIKIFGEDLHTLELLAGEVERVMSEIPGIVDLQVENLVRMPQLHIRLDRDRAVQHGIPVAEAVEYIELALQGETATQVIDGRRIYDVVVRLNDESRNDIEAVRALRLKSLRGNMVPLGMIADVSEAAGPNTINRESTGRRIVIQANTSGRDLGGVVDQVQKIIAEEIDLPEGYFLSYEGQFQSQQSASRAILFLGCLSLLAMIVVLYTHFQSINLVLQVVLVIPLAFIGAVIGIYLTGGVFSIASMVGFITLTGIAARNSLMMISHYLHLMRYEGEGFTLEMLYRGTSERLVPVLMTAMTALLALTPLLLAGDAPGKEILFPVAVVIFSGLFSSTALNLLLTPLIFWRFSKNTVDELIPELVKK